MALYKTFMGKLVDMEELRRKHKKEVAAGNANMNAHGDILGPGGKIVKNRSNVVRQHHDSTKSITQTGVSIHGDAVDSNHAVFPEEVRKKQTKRKSTKVTKKVEKETENGDIIVEEVSDDEDSGSQG